MANGKLLVGSHAPYLHIGSSITSKSYDIMIAGLPAVIFGISQYGVPALRVVALSISTAMLWEFLMNRAMKKPITIGDGNAAVIGLLIGMLLPATAPWWFVALGTLLAVLVGKQIYGGIGCNPMNPPVVAIAALMLSWSRLLDFNAALTSYDFGFPAMFPLAAIKYFGPSAAENYTLSGLLMGQQAGGIGTTFGLGLILGGLYLILRGSIRWELALGFLVGVFVTAFLFHAANPAKYAPALFHVLTGYTLIGAFFLITEDSTSPVNLVPMLLYGIGAGFLTVMIRNVGFYVDGVIFAVLMMNLASPLIDKIRPKALGRKLEHA
ncbi:MAG: electron transporter RnfD [Deltaproteobacteria bacterium HGW-Deltaproteobacteria-21]|nr:MAG: electron transporter RnfD [Deltaproteobacteria bacterium HGW-Deltaproteobacteria-21]